MTGRGVAEQQPAAAVAAAEAMDKVISSLGWVCRWILQADLAITYLDVK